MINSRTFWWTTAQFGIAVLATRWHTFHAYSVDLGLHHALANELFERFGRAGLGKDQLGPMFDYPSGSHWLAAALAVTTRSPLVAINMLAVLAIYSAYVAIALFLIDGQSRLSVIRLVLFLAVTWVLATMQAAFGYQVILNFFFPQLLGEAIVIVALFLLSRAYFWRLPTFDQTVVLVAGTWLLAYIQPLAALQFGGSVIVYRFLDALVGEGRFVFARQPLLRAALSAFCIVAAVLLHPALRTMRDIAAHDGYLRFGGWLTAGSYYWIVGFSFVAAILAVSGVVGQRSSYRPALILAAAATTGGALLLIQSALWVYGGIGSPYAVSKHVFFLISMSVLAFVNSIRWRPFQDVRSAPMGREVAAILPCLFAMAALTVVFGSAPRWRQDLRPVLDYQSYARHFHRYLMPVDGEGNVASLNDALTPIVNHMVSMGNLKLPYEVAKTSVTSSSIVLSTPVKYALVSSSVLDEDTRQRCGVSIPSSPRYAAVDRRCFVDSLSIIAIDVPLKAAANERGAKYLTHGWSAPEGWGTWSASESARIEFAVDPRPGAQDYLLRLKYIAFIAGTRQQQQFSVLVDGKPAASRRVADSQAHQILVPVVGSGAHVVELRIDGPVSPRELGLSTDDERRLGVGILELELLGSGAR